MARCLIIVCAFMLIAACLADENNEMHPNNNMNHNMHHNMNPHDHGNMMPSMNGNMKPPSDLTKPQNQTTKMQDTQKQPEKTDNPNMNGKN